MSDAPEVKPLSKQYAAVIHAAEVCQREGRVNCEDLARVARIQRKRIYEVIRELQALGLWDYTHSAESLAPPEVLADADLKPEPQPKGASVEEWRAWSERELDRMRRVQHTPTSGIRGKGRKITFGETDS